MSNKSMINAAITYAVGDDVEVGAESLNELLAAHPCPKCVGEVAETIGFVPVFGDEYAFEVDGAIFFKVRTESAILPSSVISEALQSAVKDIEKRESRKLTKPERQDLRDQITADLLRKSHRKATEHFGYFDVSNPSRLLLVIGVNSEKQAEKTTGLLRKALGSLPITPMDVSDMPAILTEWLRDWDECKAPFWFAGKVVLAGDGDESGKKAGFSGYDGTDADEIKSAIESGNRFQSGELILFNDDGCKLAKFKLSDSGALSGISLGDVITDELANEDPQDEKDLLISDLFMSSSAVRGIQSALFTAGVFKWPDEDGIEGDEYAAANQ